ncbi:glycoside hydrolase family 5 protein [Gilvimarinus algae]|uniref:Glycoside hydrolase family 5 protein n=1 Tax=Gilvimarinus algae TaxID=3058037 RepID=A0ABT8TDH4_9GAMM|nr:glycoside hydrolase family 5 protein [Gilvimarinus sp. SDUM040014]MDO3382177.1 glycoside hydrolase family 5 protein [Gilvimarinus sp. SDUM040014]
MSIYRLTLLTGLLLALCACGSSGGGPSKSSAPGVFSSSEAVVSSSSSESSVSQSSLVSSSSSAVSMAGMSSVELTREMGVGWNLGNTLEALGSETAWGNPITTPELLQAVKAAGFDTVRIPVAWSRFSDEASFSIEPAWMERVHEVVTYALDAELYVMLNIHWDGGWMQPTYAEQDYVRGRLAVMWQQIAERFSAFGSALLFACTNEVLVEGDYGTPTEEYYTVQNGFNQVCVDTIRATGGNNTERFVVVQGFNTNIDHTLNFFEMPEDPADDKLLVEVHYYDPYNFTLNPDSQVTQWGDRAEDASLSEPWANETHVDAQFGRMKSRFVDQGVGVILGEYGAMSRFQVPWHEAYRVYWNQYVTASAVTHGLVPVYWDAGYTGDGGSGLFNRATGEVVYPAIVEAITRALQAR